VTPEYIASKLSLLPQFEVVSLDHRTGETGRVNILQGYFSSPISNKEQAANLFLSDLRFLDGLLIAADQREHLRTVEAGGYCWSDIYEREVLGAHLAFFGNYDARHLRLAIDPDILWTRIDFRPHKALAKHFIDKDGKRWQKLSEYMEGNAIPDGAWLVDEGWDHEHCIFCLNRIDRETPGYKSHHEVYGDEWTCQWCFRNSVEQHDPRPLLIRYTGRDFSSL
jgi:hypothetical protein